MKSRGCGWRELVGKSIRCSGWKKTGESGCMYHHDLAYSMLPWTWVSCLSVYSFVPDVFSDHCSISRPLTSPPQALHLPPSHSPQSDLLRASRQFYPALLRTLSLVSHESECGLQDFFRNISDLEFGFWNQNTNNNSLQAAREIVMFHCHGGRDKGWWDRGYMSLVVQSSWRGLIGPPSWWAGSCPVSFRCLSVSLMSQDTLSLLLELYVLFPLLKSFPPFSSFPLPSSPLPPSLSVHSTASATQEEPNPGAWPLYIWVAVFPEKGMMDTTPNSDHFWLVTW